MAQIIFAGTQRGVVVLGRDNGGFKEVRRALPETPITAVAADAASGLVFAGTPDGVFRTSDEGRSWTPMAALAAKEARYIHIDRETHEVYVGTHPDIDLYISRDGGEHWEQVHFPSKVPPAVREKWVFHPFPRYGPHVKSIGTSRGRIYLNIEEGWCYRSDDHGASWEPLLYNGLNIDAHVLAAHPRDRDVIYSTDAFGACRSADGGRSWRRINPGEYGPKRYGGGITVHPKKPHIALFSLGLARVFTLSVKGAESAIFRTTDDGESWHQVSRGLPERVNGRVESLVFDHSDDPLLYAFTDLGDLFEGREDGGEWRVVAAGLGRSSAYYTLGVM